MTTTEMAAFFTLAEKVSRCTIRFDWKEVGVRLKLLGSSVKPKKPFDLELTKKVMITLMIRHPYSDNDRQK